METLLYPILSLGGLGLVFGLILGYASKKLAIEVDERIPLIREVLPGANCGGCGYVGCDDYAKAIVENNTELNLCSVGSGAVALKLGEIMDKAVEIGEIKKAYIKCQGTTKNAKQKYNYEGPNNCLDASNITGAGPKSCIYGCLGFGSCAVACPNGSIQILNGIAVVDENTCVGCGICVKTCPKHVIELTPQNKPIRVTCNSKLKGVIDVRTHCIVGCIACGICQRDCPSQAIQLVNSLPVIDYNKCIGCDECVQKCPSKSILHSTIQ